MILGTERSLKRQKGTGFRAWREPLLPWTGKKEVIRMSDEKSMEAPLKASFFFL